MFLRFFLLLFLVSKPDLQVGGVIAKEMDNHVECDPLEQPSVLSEAKIEVIGLKSHVAPPSICTKIKKTRYGFSTALYKDWSVETLWNLQGLGRRMNRSSEGRVLCRTMELSTDPLRLVVSCQ